MCCDGVRRVQRRWFVSAASPARPHAQTAARDRAGEWCSRSGLCFVQSLTVRASLTHSSCIIFSELLFFFCLQRNMAVLIAKPRLLPLFPPVSFIATGLPVKAPIMDVNMLKSLAKSVCMGLGGWNPAKPSSVVDAAWTGSEQHVAHLCVFSKPSQSIS